MKGCYLALMVLGAFVNFAHGQDTLVPSSPTYYGEKVDIDSYSVGDLLNQVGGIWVDIGNAGRLAELINATRPTIPIGDNRTYVVWQRDIPHTEFSVYESLTPAGSDVIHSVDLHEYPLPIVIANRGETSPCVTSDCVRMNSIHYVPDDDLFLSQRLFRAAGEESRRLSQQIQEKVQATALKSQQQWQQTVGREREQEVLRARSLQTELRNTEAVLSRQIDNNLSGTSATNRSGTSKIDRTPGFSQIYFDDDEPQVIANPQPN